jgi:TolA-binding protein
MPFDVDHSQPTEGRGVPADGPTPAQPLPRNGDGPTVGPPSRVEPQPPALPPPPHARLGVGSLLLVLILAAMGGGAGAWVYETQIAAPEPETTTEASTTAEPASAPAPPATLGVSAEDIKDVDQKIEGLAMRVDRLQERVAGFSTKQEPFPDLSTIKDQIAQLGKQLNAVAAVPDRFDAVDQRLTSLEERLLTLRSQVSALREAALKANGRARPAGATPAPNARASHSESEQVADEADLSLAIDLIKKGRYAEARDALRTLERNDADDARVWYAAALTNGFLTHQWRGETERLVNKGVERERAGTPPSSLIDSMINDLPPSSQKWLAAYRKRAQPTPSTE